MEEDSRGTLVRDHASTIEEKYRETPINMSSSDMQYVCRCLPIRG